MKNRFACWFLFALTLAVAAIEYGPAIAQQTPLRKITLAPAGDGLHFTPLHVAINGGFFKQEGLEVDWVNVASGPRTAAAIMSGSAHLAPLGFFEVIKTAMEGGNLVALSTEYNTYAMTLVLSKDALAKTGITENMPIDEKIKRLNGLRIGISSAGSSTDAFARSLFLARNLNPDQQIKLQPIGDGAAIYAAFERGLTDGFVWSAPMPELAVVKGLGQIAISPFRNEVPELKDVAYGVLVTSRETLAKEPALLRSAIRAYTRALKLIKENPEEARRLVRMRFPDVDEGAFNLAFDTYRRGIPDTAVITPEQVQHTVDWRNLGAKSPITGKYETVVAPEIAKEAMKDVFGK